MASKNVFLKGMSDKFIRDVTGDDSKKSVTIPGSDGMRFLIDADQVHPTADKNGNPVKGHSNVRLGAPGTRLEVTMDSPETGNPVKKDLSVEAISGAWGKAQSEFAEKNGAKVYLNGVAQGMVHESNVPMNDGSGHKMWQVSVADPASARQPKRDDKGQIIPGEFRDASYGSFLVPFDAVQPCGSDDKKVNIYIGREKNAVRGYQIFTGEYDENGKGIYEKASRTAGEVRDQYQKDIADYKSKMAEKDGKAVEDPNKGVETPGE